VVIDLRPLLLTQWRQLAKKLNIAALANKGKGQIRFGFGQAQARGAEYDNGETQRAKAQHIRTSTFLRLINALSSPEYLPDFLKSNDRKVRADHETGVTNKKFYQMLADRFNDTEEDNSDILLIQFAHLDETIADAAFSYDLTVFNHKNTAEVKKMVQVLIRGRKKMKENMSVSGTHSSDPWEFSQVATKYVGGVSDFELVYFYRFCSEHNDEIDSSFNLGGSVEMTGDSVSTVTVKSNRGATKAGSMTNDLTNAIDSHSQALCEQLRQRNELVAKGMDLDSSKNDLAVFFKCLEHAKDHDLASPLRKMAERQAAMIGKKHGWGEE
jgi:hypothetical protein